ncbi:unnamed protein product, partial [Choristocarpus tenellus]
DNYSAVHWFRKCGGAKDRRAGGLMRIMGVLEIAGEWSFTAEHVAGKQNNLADGISRWKRDEIQPNLLRAAPGSGREDGVFECLAAVYARGSVAPSTQKCYEAAWDQWSEFRTYRGLSRWIDPGCREIEVVKALAEFMCFCCGSRGNQVSTIKGKMAAIQYYHKH